MGIIIHIGRNPKWQVYFHFEKDWERRTSLLREGVSLSAALLGLFFRIWFPAALDFLQFPLARLSLSEAQRLYLSIPFQFLQSSRVGNGSCSLSFRENSVVRKWACEIHMSLWMLLVDTLNIYTHNFKCWHYQCILINTNIFSFLNKFNLKCSLLFSFSLFVVVLLCDTVANRIVAFIAFINSLLLLYRNQTDVCTLIW